MIGFWTSSWRCYHSSKVMFGASTSLLGKLRKSTGFSISNCKKALENFPDDLPKAEQWLQEEAKKMGWSKWNKIQSRNAAQGLIGVYVEKNIGLMVEVNCETDFVAKNVEFRDLVGKILFGCLEKTEQCEISQDQHYQKRIWNENDLMNFKFNSFTMQDLLNAAVSKFNEKTVCRRAVVLKTNGNVSISGLSHPTDTSLKFYTGKFGALVTYQLKGEDKTVGTNLCQHIIGMNPLSVGVEDIKELENVERQDVGDAILEHPDKIILEDSDKIILKDSDETILKDSDETRLLFQPYLLDPDLRVYDYVRDNAEILDFERFERGI